VSSTEDGTASLEPGHGKKGANMIIDRRSFRPEGEIQWMKDGFFSRFAPRNDMKIAYFYKKIKNVQ